MRYHIYRTGGSYVGPVNSRWNALKVIKAMYDGVSDGSAIATLYVENDLGALKLVKTYYRLLEDKNGPAAMADDGEDRSGLEHDQETATENS